MSYLSPYQTLPSFPSNPKIVVEVIGEHESGKRTLGNLLLSQTLENLEIEVRIAFNLARIFELNKEKGLPRIDYIVLVCDITNATSIRNFYKNLCQLPHDYFFKRVLVVISKRDQVENYQSTYSELSAYISSIHSQIPISFINLKSSTDKQSFIIKFLELVKIRANLSESGKIGELKFNLNSDLILWD